MCSSTNITIKVYNETDFDEALQNDNCTIDLESNLNITNMKTIESKNIEINMNNFSLYLTENNSTNSNYLFYLSSSAYLKINALYEVQNEILSQIESEGIFYLNNSNLEITTSSIQGILIIGNENSKYGINLLEESAATIQGEVNINANITGINIEDSELNIKGIQIETEEKGVTIQNILSSESEGSGISATNSVISIDGKASIYSKNIGINLETSELELIGGNNDENKISIGSTDTLTGIKFGTECKINFYGIVNIESSLYGFIYDNSNINTEDKESIIIFNNISYIKYNSDTYETIYRFKNEENTNNLYYNIDNNNNSLYLNVSSMNIYTVNSSFNYYFQIKNNYTTHKTISENSDQLDLFANNEGEIMFEILNQGQEKNYIKNIYTDYAKDENELFYLVNATSLIYGNGKSEIELTYNRELIGLKEIKMTNNEQEFVISSSNINSTDNVYTFSLDLDGVYNTKSFNYTAILGDDLKEIEDTTHLLNIIDMSSLILNNEINYDFKENLNILLPLNFEISNITLVFNYDLSDISFKKLTINNGEYEFEEEELVKSGENLLINLSDKITNIEKDLSFTLTFNIYENEYTLTYSILCLKINSISPIKFIYNSSTTIEMTSVFSNEIENDTSLQIIKNGEESPITTITEFTYDSESSSENNYIYYFTIPENLNLYGTYDIKLLYHSSLFSYLKEKSFIVYQSLNIKNILINNELSFDEDNYNSIILLKSSNISSIQIEFNDIIYENRITISNSENYNFTYTINQENESIIIIKTNEEIGSSDEDILSITIKDILNSNNPITFEIKLLELKSISPNKIEFTKNSEDEQSEISLTYNMKLINALSFQLIKYVEEKEQSFKTILINETTSIEDGLYKFNLSSNENLTGEFFIKTLFEDEYLNFVNKLISINITIKEKEDDDDDDEGETSIVALIIVLIVLVGVLLITIIILFVKRGKKKSIYDKIHKTSFTEKHMDDKEKEEELVINDEK